MNRRGFFKSIVPNKVKEHNKTINRNGKYVIRPPYNQDNALFQKECPQCDGKCSRSCKQDIIKIARDQTPFISFNGNKGCTYCEKCAEACDQDVLRVENEYEYINAIACLDKITCLAWNQNICRSCLDVCEHRAIKFVGGLWVPNIDGNFCSGCGLCVGVCPNNSLSMSYKEKEG